MSTKAQRAYWKHYPEEMPKKPGEIPKVHSRFTRKRPKIHAAPRTWLIHVQPEVDGFTHFLLVATSIDEAWKQAMDLPRVSGTAPRLGGIVDAGHWPSFMAVKLKDYCNECNHKSLLIAPSEEHEWEQMALAFEAGWKEVIQ